MFLALAIGLLNQWTPNTVGLSLIQASHSLNEAHSENLIHRDVKPANLYTCRMGLDLDFVKVLDFGLVKITGPQGVNQSFATTPGATAGTPAFMAPEVAMGEPGLDGRADIYALGCVGYWLLTGQLLFDADTAIKMMFEQINTQPLPPSQQSELEIPEALDEVILSCLAKKKEDRPATAADLAARLAAIDVREAWTQERAARWWRTHLPGESAPVPAALTA